MIELFGHNREAGYVTTQYFGDKAMFQIDVPELPLRDYELKRPQYIGSTLAPVGTKVQKAAKEGRTRIISPGAVYALNPCSKDLCLAALEELAPREIKIVELAKSNQIGSGQPDLRSAEDSPSRPEEEEYIGPEENGDGLEEEYDEEETSL